MTLPYDDDPPRRPELRAVDEPPVDPYEQRHTRLPPQNHAAEQAVLGALILKPELAPTLALELDASDFYRPQHETIWHAIHTVAAAATGETVDGVNLDAVTLASHLARTGDLDKVGGGPYLLNLTQACPNTANAAAYAKDVRDAARLRSVAEIGTRLTQLGHAGDLTKVDLYLGDALQYVEDAAMRYGPRETTTDTGLADLNWILTGDRPTATPPIWCRRKDGTALFYAGRHNGVFGDPESGKTWLAQIAGVEALTNGQMFAMVDVDHNGQDHTAARLALLGVPWETIANPDRFRYYEPEDGDQLRHAITDITRLAPAVTLIDSIGEILPMLGVKSVDNDEITAALRTICMPPAKAGSCVISVDHLPKSAEARVTGYAIGGTAKKRAVDGAYLRVEAKIKPAPDSVGRVTLRIEKDRTGELRKTSGGGYAGTFVLDSSSTTGSIGSTTWSIGREEIPKNDDGSFRPTGLMEKVATYIADNDQCTQRDIERDVPGKGPWKRDAIKILVAEGFVARQQGPNRAQFHTLLIPYREAEDDHATPDN